MRRRGETGTTLIEVLMAMIIFGVAIMGILSIYFAAAHTGRNAIHRGEAPRLARSLLDAAERMSVAEFEALDGDGDGRWALQSGDSAVIGTPFTQPLAAGTAGLVWRCNFKKDSATGEWEVFNLTITIARDRVPPNDRFDNGTMDINFDGVVDERDADDVVWTFATRVAPRLTISGTGG